MADRHHQPRAHLGAPNFNATREASYQIEAALGVKASGEQKLSPFPSWVLSTSLQTPGKRYPFISLPVSDYYYGFDIPPSMESMGISPGVCMTWWITITAWGR